MINFTDKRRSVMINHSSLLDKKRIKELEEIIIAQYINK